MNEITQTREVLVYNQPKQKHFIFQTATDKWIDIAELIVKQAELECPSLSNMKAVLQSNKSTLELPEATIPKEGAQKIFLFEAKVKSGIDYNNFSFLELRRLAKTKGVSEGLGSNPSKSDLIDALETAAEIKKERISKTGKTGKVTTKTTKKPSSRTESIQKRDKEIIDNNPSLQEQLEALQTGFATFVTGMYELTKDYVKPDKLSQNAPSKIIGEVSDYDLKKEAESLKVR